LTYDQIVNYLRVNVEPPPSMRKKTVTVLAGGDAKAVWELIKKRKAEKADGV
jgi:hypothetical protein